MVHALAAQFPFTHRESLVPYHPAPLERYLPIAPGIEVSVAPVEDVGPGSSRSCGLYDRRGRVIHSSEKGLLINTLIR
ncbi:MAG TPA: hypothetical protein VLS90_02605 [Thermodesulfobacteriota bacterium]|nr:hypothetical protein [Thermodesulfobacteriota bacterium]